MGQHLSLRRPRISLTWVLREQQQQQQSEQQADESNVAAANSFNNNGVGYISGVECKSGEAQSTYSAASTTLVTKRRPKAKNPSSGEALNGYATTPKAHPSPAAPRKFFSNQNLLEFQEKRDASKELLLVCTPNRLPPAVGAGDCTTNNALASAKRRNEIKKKFANRLAVMQASSRAADGVEAATLHVHGSALQRDTPTTRSLKGTYSEPSLMAASEGNHRRHRHRKRRERHRVQKFGYEIRNVDEFLTRCSLAAPGNIPVVLSTSSTLYQTRPGGYQVEIPLPLGMVVNAVFKNQNWLYVQTPHAEEGYVGYAYCLPLGILPPAARGGGTANGAGSASKPTPCWESNGDVFPHPCGNMTDSEKEIHLRGGTRSDGARTPRGKRSSADVDDGPTEGGMVAAAGSCSEQRVDKLYLRAASQPKLAEKAYAQLRSTKMMAATASNLNDEYVVLQQQQQQQHKTKLHVQKHLEQQQQQQQLLLKQQQYQRLQQQQLQQQHFVKSPPITNGHNGQHLHPSVGNGVHLPRSSSFNSHQVALQAAKHFAQHSSLRQTLVAINTDYTTEGITVKKGEIVTLCECRLAKDQRQWFYVKTRDGREGYIPAEVAGHGYL